MRYLNKKLEKKSKHFYSKNEEAPRTGIMDKKLKSFILQNFSNSCPKGLIVSKDFFSSQKFQIFGTTECKTKGCVKIFPQFFFH